jgi:lysozyme family protein
MDFMNWLSGNPAPQPAAVPAPAKPDNFGRCVAVTLGFEGGFVDNPADPGGATNYGITKRVLEAFLGHAVSVDDVRSMPLATANAIYRANYWNLTHCALLPSGVDLMVFDFGVNSGTSRAAKALQGIVGVPMDGAIGPATVAAARNAVDVIDALASARLAFLRSLETFATFGKGWTARVNEVHTDALAMQAGH